MTRDFNSPPKPRITQEVLERIERAMEEALIPILGEAGVKEFQFLLMIVAPIKDQNFNDGCETCWMMTMDKPLAIDMLDGLAGDLRKSIAN